MLLFLFKTSKSKKTKISASKKEEIPIKYRIEPKTSPQYPKDNVKYKVTVTNDKLDEVSGRISIAPPENWNIPTIEKEYGPLKRDEQAVLEFEFMGCAQHTRDAVDGIQAFGQIDIFGYVCQRLFFSNHGN